MVTPCAFGLDVWYSFGILISGMLIFGLIGYKIKPTIVTVIIIQGLFAVVFVIFAPYLATAVSCTNV